MEFLFKARLSLDVVKVGSSHLQSEGPDWIVVNSAAINGVSDGPFQLVGERRSFVFHDRLQLGLVDADFAGAEYRACGLYLNLRVKFDQDTFNLNDRSKGQLLLKP